MMCASSELTGNLANGAPSCIVVWRLGSVHELMSVMLLMRFPVFIHCLVCLSPTNSVVVKNNFCIWPVIQIYCLFNGVILCPGYTVPPGFMKIVLVVFPACKTEKLHDILVGGNSLLC